jgi:A/G-specific adenine glycosylase
MARSENRPAAKTWTGGQVASRRAAALAARLLRWYGQNRRHVPWRALPGERPDPYRVWVSEIMAQQTRVETAAPYLNAFLRRFPTPYHLARADLDEVLHAWQGLGYYARARNLHAAARLLVARHDGQIPDDEARLRELPGIGPYTAAAIAAIAFGQRAAVVDGNVERLLARHFALDLPLPRARPRIRELAASLVRGLPPDRHAGDYAQALMDLGGTLCAPRAPHCDSCPWAATCRARAMGRVAEFPVRTPRAATPTRRGIAFLVTRESGAVLLRRRPEKGLLGGLMEVPSTAWRERAWSLDEARKQAPLRTRWRARAGAVRHAFSHFTLELRVVTGRIPAGAAAPGASTEAIWCLPERLADHALPTLTRKVIAHGLSDG